VTETPDSPAHRRATGNGVYVILITGVLAALGFFVANRTMAAIDWALLALVAALTIGGSLALARYIRTHPNAIGEARFDTSHPDDPA
jgi:uncharacterized protein (DUF983 family)